MVTSFTSALLTLPASRGQTRGYILSKPFVNPSSHLYRPMTTQPELSLDKTVKLNSGWVYTVITPTEPIRRLIKDTAIRLSYANSRLWRVPIKRCDDGFQGSVGSRLSSYWLRANVPQRSRSGQSHHPIVSGLLETKPNVSHIRKHWSEAGAPSGVDRSKVFLTTKVQGRQHGYEACQDAILASFKESKIDYWDLILLHDPTSGSKKRLEAYRALGQLNASPNLSSQDHDELEPHIDLIVFDMMEYN